MLLLINKVDLFSMYALNGRYQGLVQKLAAVVSKNNLLIKLVQFGLNLQWIISQECLQLNLQFARSWLMDNNSISNNIPVSVADCTFLLFRNILYTLIFHIFKRESGVAEIYCSTGKRNWTFITRVSPPFSEWVLPVIRSKIEMQFCGICPMHTQSLKWLT